MKSTRLTQAFTIVELLVVIAIIGVLMALLLPAVQAARESGRRTACMANMTQMAIAVNRLDQDRGRLPGWKEAINSSWSSWPVALLPHLERKEAFDNWPAGTNDPSLSFFRCPTARADSSNKQAIAYAANCGNQANVFSSSGPNIAFNPNPHDGALIDGVNATKKTSLTDIAAWDGTSTTLLFAEKCGSSVQWKWNSNFSNSLATFVGTPGAYASDSPPSFGIDGTSASHSLFCQPSSQHPNGGVVAFCDGRTHFLSNTTALTVYAHLVTSRNSKASDTAKIGWQTASTPPVSDGDY